MNKGNHVQYATWTPSGANVVFVYKNNMYHRLYEGTERALTVDGVEDVIFNGVPDWVYEEEVIKNDNVIWFSPDGNKLAYLNINDVQVETFTYPLYGEPGNLENQYPTNVVFRYPKAGTTIPTVTLITIDLTKSTVERVKIAQPVAEIPDERILWTVVWPNNNQVLAVWLNRRQNMGVLHLCIPGSANVPSNCTNVGTLNEPTGWLDPVIQLKCSSFNSADHCYFLKNIDDWKHIAHVTLPSDEHVKVTTGNIHVLEIFGYDKTANELYECKCFVLINFDVIYSLILQCLRCNSCR